MGSTADVLHGQANAEMNSATSDRLPLDLSPSPQRHRLIVASTAALLAVFALVYSSIVHLRGAAPLDVSSPTTEFSAARALIDLRRIAASPHPMGTSEHAQVREYLLNRLRGLGLQPQVQTAFGVHTSKVQGDAIAFVSNVVARIPGTVPGKAVLLCAHYDTVPTSPGAADDTTGTAAILETVRALRASRRLQNDVIILLSDGEEHATLGAAAFVEHHPWVKDVGLALNFDFRGNSGSVYMFETSAHNGRLIDGFAAATQRPIGSSLAIEVRRLLPNGTDLTNFINAGIPSMNFAAVDSPRNYHAETDTPAQLDQRTLQHAGELMLALTRHFGNMSLDDLAADDRIFFDIPGGMIVYAKSLALPFALFTVLAIVGLLISGIRRSALRPARVLAGIPLFIGAIALQGVAAWLLWYLISLSNPNTGVLLAEHNSLWYLLTIVAFEVGFFAVLSRPTARWLSSEELSAAALIVGALLLVASAVLLPGVSFILTWPLLAVAIAQLVALHLPRRPATPHSGLWILLAGAAPGILLFTPLLDSLFSALGPKSLFIPAVALALMLGPNASLLARLHHRWLLPGVPFALALVFIVTAAITGPFNATAPQPTELFYLKDGATQKAYWVSGDKQLSAWNSKRFDGVRAPQDVHELLGAQTRPYWLHAAPSSEIAAPQITLLEDKPLDNGERYLRVRVQSMRAAPRIKIALEGATVLSSTIAGEQYPKVPRENWVFSAYAMPGHTVDVEFRVPGHLPINIRAIDFSYGLDAVGVEQRPRQFMSYPFGASDTVQAVSVLSISS